MQSAHGLAPGERLGASYAVRSELAPIGGVRRYEADDLLLHRRVTLEVSDGDGAPDLIRRAKRLAAVRHPALPFVYGLGSHRGLAYLAMERLDGVTLAEAMVARRREPTWFHVAEIVPVLTTIAEALAAIHDAGCAHGALDADQILLAAGDRVLVLGFGIVDGGTADGDVAAFGRLAYELFIGEPHLAGDDDIAALRPDVGPAIADLVRACLTPDERPDMGSIADELRAVPRRRGRRPRPKTASGPYRMAAR